MLATFVTLAVISFALAGLRDLARRDGAKIIAAIQGNSWAAHRTVRPAAIGSRAGAKVSQPAWPELRAAA